MSGLSIRAALQPLTVEAVKTLTATLGVYEITDAAGAPLLIGFAGGRSLFGLRSELYAQLDTEAPNGRQFRVEYNMQYMSRWKELLMDHVRHHGSLPPLNSPTDGHGLGRLGQPNREGHS